MDRRAPEGAVADRRARRASAPSTGPSRTTPSASSAPRSATASATSCRSCSRCWRPRSRSRSRPTPSHEQARRGWARENAEGVPVDAPHRNYRDPNHKPELVCALTPFTALKGFRPARRDRPQPRAGRAPRDRAASSGALAREQTPARAARALRPPHDARPRGAGAGARARDRRGRAPARDATRPGSGSRGCMTHYPGDVSAARPALPQPRDARPGRGALPARRRAARLPRGHGARDHGELGQRAARAASPRSTWTSRSCWRRSSSRGAPPRC